MRSIAALIIKDLRRKMRAPAHVILMLLFPLALVAIVGLVFRPGSGVSLPPIRILVENHDEEFLGNLLGSALQNERVGEFFDVEIVEEGTGEEVVAGGDATALLVIPERFTGDILEGKPATLSLVKDPGGVILPEIAENVTEMLATILSAASRILREPLSGIREMMEASTDPPEESVANVAVLVQRGFQRAERFLLPPAIEVVKEREVVEGEEEKESINLFAYLLPGMLAIGLLFVAQISMRDMVRERESGHLGRLLSTPTSIVSIITSKLVSTIILLVLCHILLAVVSTFLFGIRWSNLPASFLLVLAEGIAITGLLALLFSITTTERQGDALSSVVILGMSLIGGSMVPLDMFPEGMQSFGRLTLNYYAIEGFRQVLVWEGGLGAVLRPLAILTLFGLVTTAIAAILLPRNLRRRG